MQRRQKTTAGSATPRVLSVPVLFLAMTTALLMSSNPVHAFASVMQKADAAVAGSSKNVADSSIPDKTAVDNSAYDSTASSVGSNSPDARGMDRILDWAAENDVKFGDGCELKPSSVSADSEDWGINSKKPLEPGSVVLTVPRSLVLSSKNVLKTIGQHDLKPAFDTLEEAKCSNLKSHFLLFVQLLKEFEKGKSSTWQPWLQSMPKKFDTALYMTAEEMGLLAPFAFALADLQKRHFQVFRSALAKIDVVSRYTLADIERLKTAYSIVFTRSWRSDDSEDVNCSDICPIGDMFNHASAANIVARYTSEDQIDFVVKNAITEPNQPLHLSYGFPTNPYRFLCIFGFVDETQDEIFIQVLFSKPSPRHIALGCIDRQKMVFRSSDGAVADAVWDCVLYALLDQVPEEQELFWQACEANDTQKKMEFHEKYRLEVCLMLKQHISKTCGEFSALVGRGNTLIRASSGARAKEHRILPKIQQQNEFLLESFSKVQRLLDTLIQQETEHRKSAA